jgi:shikimate dehydrogenase
MTSPQAAPDTVIALDDTSHLTAALAAATLLVNATPVGMGEPDAAPIPLDLLVRLPAGAFDLVYSPPETALVRAARVRGLRASGGLPMLLYQGAAAFTLWTGQPAPVEVMHAVLVS